MKKFQFLIIFLFFNIKIFSIFRTPEAGRYYQYLFSPELLSRGMGIIGFESPSSIVINPASNAFIQNIKIDSSFGFSPAFFNNLKTASDFFLPFILNTSFVLPTKYGNFTALVNYSNMSNLNFKKEFYLNYGNYNELNYGKVGTFYLNFSKDYLEKFAFGFNGNIKIGYNPASKYPNNKFDISSTLGIGFIFKPEWYFPFLKSKATGWAFQNFNAAITFLEIGKPFINTENGINGDKDIYWFPPPFTPGFGCSIDLYNDNFTYWKLLFDTTFPFFQNLTFSIGTEIQILKFLILRGSYTFDLEGTLEYAKLLPRYENIYNLANFSFGSSFKIEKNMFTREERKKGNSYSIDFAIKPYHEGVIILLGSSITFGVKDKNPPQLNVIQKNNYISPNFDGINDELILDMDIKDERYIIYWKFDIYNEKGENIRTIESKQPRQEVKKIKDIIKEYFSPKSGIPIPKELIWDGTDKYGNIVKDGIYNYKLIAMDDNKNVNTLTGKVVVDTEKPFIKCNIQNPIFSPNDDGVKDSLIIDITIFEDGIKIEPNKQKWNIDIFDTKDNLIKRFIFTDKGKYTIEWNGKDENGNKLPDGIYYIKLHSIDEAGNYWENIIQNIIIDTQEKPIKLLLINNYFSPNNDGINDEVLFKTEIPIKTGIEEWIFQILDENNNVIYEYNDKTLPPSDIKWNGKNKEKQTAKEGKYKANIVIKYISGNLSKATTPNFYLDLTPPYCEIEIEDYIFSPNNDGKKDYCKIIHSKFTEENQWSGSIFDENNKIVRNFIWKGTLPVSLIWDGKDNNGKLLKDGTYYYQISSKDEAGNLFISEKHKLIISTLEVPVFISYYYESFSPNNDGILDEQLFDIRINQNIIDPVINWSIDIYNENDVKIFTKIGTQISENITLKWDGKNEKMELVPDGYYYAKLIVNYKSGLKSENKTPYFYIDTKAPYVEVLPISLSFSPNNDGFLDYLEILQKGSKEENWEVFIINEKNEIVWKKSYKGEPIKKEIWDGKDIKGNLLPNGKYTYVIKSIDKAGNKGEAKIENIQLLNIVTSCFISVDFDKFSPNNDGILDNISFKILTSYNKDIEQYLFEIIDQNGKSIRSISGKEKLPEQFIWDGKDDLNNQVKDGEYKAKISIIYSFGNRITSESKKIILDTTGPDMNVIPSPMIFSPDDDGFDDEITLSISSYDLSGIKDWKLTILDSNGKSFKTFSGTGNITKKIVWDGKSDNGELVESAEDYTVKINAIDNVGNSIEKLVATLKTDILVLKLKDGRYKIRISNIEFKSDSDEMTESNKNKEIIELLAKALNKYKNYKVRIEGHANKYREDLNETIARNLSFLRAKKVAAELEKRGVAANRMTIIGKGFDEPLVPLEKGVSPELLAKNRRVEFYLER